MNTAPVTAPVNAPVTAPVAAPVTAPKVNGVTPPKAPATAKAPAKAQAKAPAKGKAAAKAPEAPAKRTSRIAPVQAQLLATLAKVGAKGATVAAMAVQFKATEREVRLAIDRARNGAVKIDRISKGTFAFAKGYTHK